MTPASPPAQPADPPQDELALRAEQVRLLFRFSLVGYLATLMVVLTLGALLWNEMSRPALFAWFVAASLVTVGRYLIYKAFIQASPDDDATLKWEPRFLAQPQDALNHALLAIRDLPEAEKQLWRQMFDHYVFSDPADAAEHIPERARGILAPLDAESAGRIRANLLRSLSR